MLARTLFFAASAAVVSAQATYDEATGLWRCAKPNTAFCAGDSLQTDIIIRCNEAGIGQAGRCSNNLNGQPPQSLKTARCYQPDATSGTAGCEKNCVVYNGDGSKFTLPASLCTPAVPGPTTTRTFIDPIPTNKPNTTRTFVDPIPTSKPNTTRTFIDPIPTSKPTTTITYIDDWGVSCTTTITIIEPISTGKPTTTITYIDDWGVPCTTTLWQPIPPKTTLTTAFINPTQPHGPAVTGTGNGGYTNGTCVGCPGGNNGQGGNQGGEGGRQPPVPTKVPDQVGPSQGSGKPDEVGPSGKPGPSLRPTPGLVTAGAASNGIAGAAVLAMLAAYML